MAEQGGRAREGPVRAAPAWLEYCGEFLRSLPSGVLIVDSTGRVAYGNPAAARLLALGEPFLVGRRYDDPLLFGALLASPAPSDDPTRPSPDDGDPIALALATGEPCYAMSVALERPSSGRTHLSLDVIPLHSPLGGSAGAAVAIRDETEEVARRSESEWLRGELTAAREHVEENLRLSDALNRIGEIIHSTLDFEEVLRRVVRDATEAIRASSGLIEVREAGGWVPRVVFGLPEGILGRALNEPEAMHAAIVAETREALSVSDSFTDDRFDHDLVRKFKMRGFLTVPLLLRDEVFAVLSFHNPFRTRFSYDQVSFASKVATTTSLAMENARVYGEERHIADTLQQALVAVPSAVTGMTFEHAYRSATEAAWVGGDFFDMFELPGRRVGIVIGDVSGKGVEASALASFTRQLLKAHAQEDLSPAEVVERTNKLVFLTSRTEDFVTLFFGLYSLDDDALTFCGAGHPPPIVWHDGRAEPLTDGGPFVGAWDDLHWEDSTTHLSPGDVLVLYTDGVIEAKAGGDLFGEERLLALVESLAPAPLDRFTDSLLREVTAFAGGRLRDDVAVLLVSPT